MSKAKKFKEKAGKAWSKGKSYFAQKRLRASRDYKERWANKKETAIDAAVDSAQDIGGVLLGAWLGTLLTNKVVKFGTGGVLNLAGNFAGSRLASSTGLGILLSPNFASSDTKSAEPTTFKEKTKSFFTDLKKRYGIGVKTAADATTTTPTEGIGEVKEFVYPNETKADLSMLDDLEQNLVKQSVDFQSQQEATILPFQPAVKVSNSVAQEIAGMITDPLM